MSIIVHYCFENMCSLHIGKTSCWLKYQWKKVAISSLHDSSKLTDYFLLPEVLLFTIFFHDFTYMFYNSNKFDFFYRCSRFNDLSDVSGFDELTHIYFQQQLNNLYHGYLETNTETSIWHRASNSWQVWE